MEIEEHITLIGDNFNINFSNSTLHFTLNPI